MAIKKQRALSLDVALAAVFGVVLFALLNIVTGGVLVSLLTTLAAMLLFGLGHYIFWGQVLSRTVAEGSDKEQARARPQGPTSAPDEVTLALNERERLELLRVLEQSLAEQAARARQPVPATDKRAQADEALLRKLLEKIRIFGA
jgi:hypothetical protein